MATGYAMRRRDRRAKFSLPERVLSIKGGCAAIEKILKNGFLSEMLSTIHFYDKCAAEQENTLVVSILLGSACLAAFSLIAPDIFRWTMFQVFDIRNHLTLHLVAYRLETRW